MILRDFTKSKNMLDLVFHFSFSLSRRAPPERKSKDPHSVKRVRKKRYRTVDNEDNEMPEEKEVIEEEENVSVCWFPEPKPKFYCKI